jgi:hypothetical protein
MTQPTIFDIIKNIRSGAKLLTEEEFEKYKSIYNPFFVMQALSMDMVTAFNLYYFNTKEFTYKIKSYIHYKALHNMCLSLASNKFVPFLKQQSKKYSSDCVKGAKRYFNVRFDVALDYLDCMKEEDRNKLEKWFKEDYIDK